MAQKSNIEILPITGPAVGAITANRFGKIVETGLAMCDTEGERADGIFGYAYVAGYKMAVLYMLGTRTVEAGAAVTAGAEVMTDADGKAIAATATNAVAGIAMYGSAAAADGDFIQIMHIPGGIVR